MKSCVYKTQEGIKKQEKSQRLPKISPSTARTSSGIFQRLEREKQAIEGV
ncbi:MAG: hypothetical protein H6618_06215 [Deltaproteobacteria bacterium]|nr:hypothetical protein [Deltaproteobacteria bacterium]